MPAAKQQPAEQQAESGAEHFDAEEAIKVPEVAQPSKAAAGAPTAPKPAVPTPIPNRDQQRARYPEVILPAPGSKAEREGLVVDRATGHLVRAPWRKP